jgi:hypothetical protein
LFETGGGSEFELFATLPACFPATNLEEVDVPDEVEVPLMPAMRPVNLALTALAGRLGALTKGGFVSTGAFLGADPATLATAVYCMQELGFEYHTITKPHAQLCH